MAGQAPDLPANVRANWWCLGTALSFARGMRLSGLLQGGDCTNLPWAFAGCGFRPNRKCAGGRPAWLWSGLAMRPGQRPGLWRGNRRRASLFPKMTLAEPVAVGSPSAAQLMDHERRDAPSRKPSRRASAPKHAAQNPARASPTHAPYPAGAHNSTGLPFGSWMRANRPLG